jgi:alpha-tubulin suppressor-like RCC1 family protein
LQQRISILKSLFSKIARPVVSLSAVLTLSAASLLLSGCGAGVSEVANLATNTTVTAVVSPTRVVAGQIYTYQAAAPSGASVTWNWGDGSPDSVGTTVQKVWNKAGRQTVTLSANASGNTTAVTQSVVVSGEPVSAGREHTCALQPSGTVLCWGDNSTAQLGDGSVNSGITTAVVVSRLTDAIALSAGAFHTCALKAGGSVACWGSNSNGQLGRGNSIITPGPGVVPDLSPGLVRGLTDAVAISAGSAHTCALKASGGVACWGFNDSGTLGNGTTTQSLVPVDVVDLKNAVAISAGNAHTCALKADRTLACWGWNNSGQLGIGAISLGGYKDTPTPVLGLTDTVAISAGFNHTCALKANGSAACWGNNTSGEVGDNTTLTRVITTAVIGLTDAVAINAGGNETGGQYRGRSCALKANGSAVCWGDKGYAGSGNGQVQAIPTAVAGLTDTAAISMGGDHTCALKASGAVACWGNHVVGQLGDGTFGAIQTKLVEVTAPGGVLTDTLSVSAGFSHTCAVKTGGTVVCWGDNQYGQLGDGTTTTRTVSAAVTGLTDAVAVAAGRYHTCAVKSDKTAVCWGYNFEGQLGNGTTSQSSIPVPVNGLSEVVALTASSYTQVLTTVSGQTRDASGHSCALISDGRVFCWGYGADGQLGNGLQRFFITTGFTFSSTPTAVIGLSDAIEVSVGSFHSCARKANGNAVCWGENSSGQLGNGTTTISATPTAVSDLTGVLQINAGGNHTCARKADNTVSCWGSNSNGELGNGTTTASLTPTPVRDLTDVDQLSASFTHTCAKKTDSTVVCMGSNSDGQLGNGTNSSSANSNTPTPVSNLTDVDKVSASFTRTCARKTDSTVVCWGRNNLGQLGGSTFINTSIKPRPTAVLGGSIFWK